MSVTLEVLHVADCPNVAPLLDRLGEVTDLAVATREIATDEEAAAAGMAGSPTLLVNGVDPFAPSGACECSVSCRLYRDETGRLVTVPTVGQLRAALVAADAGAPVGAAGMLSSWRSRALPMDRVERAVHQAVLRRFAATGAAPRQNDLDPVTAGTGCSTADVLAALHDLDAIRLGPDGQILVAYPFSATPTRHRVWVGDQSAVDRPGGDAPVLVHAMCAIDALGISAMLNLTTRIESVDVTSGRPITIISSGGHTNWRPATAVAFVGADTCGGPSADCCCGYLNMFADRDAAQAWADAHPSVPGQILNQDEAEELAIRLFGHLLATD